MRVRGRAVRTISIAFVSFVLGGLVMLVAHPMAEAVPRSDSPFAILEQLGRVLVSIENFYVEPVERTRLVEGAIKGMVEALDPHSSYLPPRDFTVFQSDTEGKFGGVGIEVDTRGDMLTVIAPIEGSPAERAGILPGDRIIAIDGRWVQGGDLDRLILSMRGAPGTHVKLSVRRAGVKAPLTFDLARAIIRVPSVVSKLLDGGIAYVRIKQFQQNAHDELIQALKKMHAAAKAPFTGVVLDLRNNPGGLVNEASAVADEFLTEGLVFTTRHRGQVLDEVSAHSGGELATVPTVVIVNEGSASAAELVAGALQDHKRALLVGARTFGKGSVQSIFELPGGAGLRLTIARYYLPAGRAVQAQGVAPDIWVDAATPEGSEGLPSFREQDLAGHLSEEKGRGGSAAPARQVHIPVPSSGGDESGEARNVPGNPSLGHDVMLKVAYEALRGAR